ncbi:synaptonemal complex protein 2 isoform X4 [Acanthopagrus latus]|uniref:synaptonemal complex protein 2 isoform X4 n=1 Tax=Acanthopagrus latus TaxID=8177 RepID=UPI00187BD66E|nr:synaptonemal complex protein 2 isoform X4 [Acanthopagrus latus]
MAQVQASQLEKVIEGVLKSGDVQALDVFLQGYIHEGLSVKCSHQFLTKLDKLVSRSLDQKDSKLASLGFAILYKFGKNLKLPGDCEGLPALIAQGLLKKMVQWFEKCRQLWIQRGPQWDESLFNLSEDFFDAFMVVHESCKEGTHKITESFLYPVGQLAVDPRIYVLIQKEAIRKFNLILDKIPVELKQKRKILTSQEASDIMFKLAGHIMEGGDYDLQTALMEALCRMATPEQRKELADRWFSMQHVASAFVKIRDSEFETDCRKFLNLVNGMQGDRRRVYSYPCLEVYLDKYELLMPADEKLEEFWIDFNLGSHSISFYFSLAGEEAQEGQWETICINENEVKSYSVTACSLFPEKGKRHILHLKLSEVVVMGAVEGSTLTIHFSSSLDILQAARNVYGHIKNKGFVGKKGTSVAKTTIKVLMEENSSQVVPESQVSHGESEKSTAPYPLPAPSAPIQTVTPAKMKMSESTTFISSSGGGSVHSAHSLSVVMPSNTSAKVKAKLSLEMVRSCDKKGDCHLAELRTTDTPNTTLIGCMIEQSDTSLQSMVSKQASKNKESKYKKNIPLAKAADMVLAGQGEEEPIENSFVPDTQPRSSRNTSSNWSKLSVSEMLMMPTQKIISQPRPEPCSSLSQQQEHPFSAKRSSVPLHGPISQKQFHSELTKRLKPFLSKGKQDLAPQEPALPQRKMPENSEGSKDRSSLERCAPKEKQVQRNCLAKGKSKGQMSLEADAAPIKSPANASSTKAVQERRPANVKADTSKTFSNKENRDAELASSMVKLISRRYDSTAKHTAENIPQIWNLPLINSNRPIFNMSWSSTVKKEVSGAVSLNKSNNKTATSHTKQRKDIFAFAVDSPLSIRGKDKTFNSTSAISSSSFHDSSALPTTTKKGQPVAKEKRHVKKHLFSDTDTDYATEVSWLRESGRKPKPKVTKYSRQAPVKPKAVTPHTSYESPDLPPSPQKPLNGNTKPNKKKPDMERMEHLKTLKPAAAPKRPNAANRRPQRAAATAIKCYKDPDTDESHSESEKPPVSKAKNLPLFYSSSIDHLEHAEKTHEAGQVMKKKTAIHQPTKSYVKLERKHGSNQSELVSEPPPTSKKCFVGQQGRIEKTYPQVKKRNSTSSRRQDSNMQSDLKKPSDLKQQRPENVVPESSKFYKRNASPAQEQMNALKDPWAARQTSFHSCPRSIERIRSAERSAPTLGLTCSSLLTPRGSPLPASPEPPCEDTPSPILLLPKPRSTVSSKGHFKPSSFYSAEKKPSTTKTQSLQPGPTLPSLTPVGQTLAGPSAEEMSPIQQPSPLPSPLSLPTVPLLTSTLLELDKVSLPSPSQSPFPGDTDNHGCRYGFSKISSVSQVSLSMSSTKSSVVSVGVKDSPTAVSSIKAEKSPPSDPQHAQPIHISGPSRKRCISSSSNFEEDENGERKKSKIRGQRSPRMKPRKLFKSFVEVSADSQVSQVLSSSHTVSSSHWEVGVGDEDMDMDEDSELPKPTVNPSNLCQQFSSDLKKKFENRYRMMEVYNKQSLKAVQQHVSLLNMQVTKYRTERLERVREVLSEEICKLEQDDTVLKNMEKDLAMHWKKQSVAFHAYKEQKIRRNETLSTALQSNVCHSVEYEERLFTSQMCLIRKDMKSVQDRLLSQMQEGEIQSVKSNLHALFFP